MRSARSSPLLVTGGAGFIGSALVEALRASGHDVAAPLRSELDLRDHEAVKVRLAALAPAGIFHLASAGVFAADLHDPRMVLDECKMAAIIADAAAPGTRIIYAGSMAEYGSSGRHREDTYCTPNNMYGRAKLEAGLLLSRIGTERGLEVINARIFGAYGPGEDPRRLLPTVFKALRNGEPVALSDGTQRRDFVHVNDVAQALIALMQTPALPPPILNVGTGMAVTVRAAVLRLAEALSADPALLRFGGRARSPHDEQILEADTAMLQKAIGWVPPQRFIQSGSMIALLGLPADA